MLDLFLSTNKKLGLRITVWTAIIPGIPGKAKEQLPSQRVIAKQKSEESG